MSNTCGGIAPMITLAVSGVLASSCSPPPPPPPPPPHGVFSVAAAGPPERQPRPTMSIVTSQKAGRQQHLNGKSHKRLIPGKLT